MSALLVIAAVVPLLPFVFVIVALVVERRRRTPWNRMAGRPLVLTGFALVTLLLGGLAYAVGVLSGFYILDPDDMCASASGLAVDASRWSGITSTWWPIHRTCEWSDGTRFELVPGWVNPTVCLTVVVAAGLLGYAVWQNASEAERRAVSR